MKILRLATLLGAGISLCASPAWAGVLCTGTVSRIIIGPDGDTYVDFGYNRVKVCVADASLTVDRGANGGQVTITPGRCSVLTSAFLTAKASGKPVGAAVERTDCNFVDGAIPNPYPYHWYFQ